MKNSRILHLDKNEISQYLNKLYEYFKDPFEFENFCKIFLMIQKFDEVEVTQRYKDGGVDLKALRKGVDESGIDTVYYDIQSKRYKPNSSVPIKDVRALRGVLKNSQHKGIFITTGKFTKSTYDYANNLVPKEIILIDGYSLVKKCIELEIGFSYKPILDISYLSTLMNKYEKEKVYNNINNVLKDISENDIKRRILPIPKSILETIPINNKSYKVRFEGKDEKILKINRERRFFSGVTSIYKKYKLEEDDKSINPVKSYWNIDITKNVINVYFNNN